MLALDDAELLEAARKGSQDAWSGLIRRHSSDLQRYAYGVLRGACPETIHDIVQTAWGQFYQMAAKGARIVSVRATMYAIVRRRCLDEMRSKYRRSPCLSLDSALDPDDPHSRTFSEWVKATDPDAVDVLIAAEKRQPIVAALSVLNERDRFLVLAHAAQGMTMREASELAIRRGIMPPGGDVEKRGESCYYRALARLREVLTPDVVA